MQVTGMLFDIHWSPASLIGLLEVTDTSRLGCIVWNHSPRVVDKSDKSFNLVGIFWLLQLKKFWTCFCSGFTPLDETSGPKKEKRLRMICTCLHSVKFFPASRFSLDRFVSRPEFGLIYIDQQDICLVCDAKIQFFEQFVDCLLENRRCGFSPCCNRVIQNRPTVVFNVQPFCKFSSSGNFPKKH